MAPVAGRVADAQKDRLILLTGQFKRLLTPREPIYWIVLVLKEIGTGFFGESIGNLGT